MAVNGFTYVLFDFTGTLVFHVFDNIIVDDLMTYRHFFKLIYLFQILYALS